MKLTSPSFPAGGKIPAVFTCDGRNISPELEISGIPKEARSLALIMDDPDSPGRTFIHWVAYDIGVAERIGENEAPGLSGLNDFGDLGYGGPCPYSGSHRYSFRIYALDRKLGLREGLNKQELLEAVQGHILEEAELIGIYSRE